MAREEMDLDMASILAGGVAEDIVALMEPDVELAGGTDDSDGADRHNGYGHWIAYLPSLGRAVAVCNGDPVWYDAVSLKDAVKQWRDQSPLIN